ncbi:MAG: hypothetical protein ACJAVV_000775 [Alphaproteobacteria bacterium]|jgi:hypothetical protein
MIPTKIFIHYNIAEWTMCTPVKKLLISGTVFFVFLGIVFSNAFAHASTFIGNVPQYEDEKTHGSVLITVTESFDILEGSTNRPLGSHSSVNNTSRNSSTIATPKMLALQQ